MPVSRWRHGHSIHDNLVLTCSCWRPPPRDTHGTHETHVYFSYVIHALAVNNKNITVVSRQELVDSTEKGSVVLNYDKKCH